MHTCSLTKLHLTLCDPWTVAHQVPLSMGFPRQEYWHGLPFPLSGDLPNPGIKLASPALQADSLLLSHQGSPFHNILIMQNKLHGLFVCTYHLYSLPLPIMDLNMIFIPP